MMHVANPWLFPTHAVALAGPLPAGAERLSVTATDGTPLSGVFIPADPAPAKGPLILGFGGNAWNAQDAATYLHEVFPDSDVVSFFYRGYAPSKGTPSIEALIADAPLAYDSALAKTGASKVVAVGFSIGSAVAASLAAERKLDGLILVTPFDSLRAVAQDMVPWLPIGPLLSPDINAAELLASNPVPVAIFTAANDELVSARRTDALRASVRNLVVDRTVTGADHNGIYGQSEFQLEMRKALARLVS